MTWHDIHDPAGHLLFRYDPLRNLIELRHRGVMNLIDLTDYQSTATSSRQNATERPCEPQDDSTWQKERLPRAAH